MTQTKPLTERALLVRLNIREWTAKRVDRAATKTVHDANQAKADAGRYEKVLIPLSALRPITHIRNAARQYHNSVTLPWMDNGTRILPSENYYDYMAKMREYSALFDKEVDHFLANLAGHKKLAKRRLGQLYREADFPIESEIREKFAMEREVTPVPGENDWRIPMDYEEKRALRDELTELLDRKQNEAMRDLWGRFLGVIEKAAKRLSIPGDAPHSGFRDSLITNIVNMVEAIPNLNIGDDAELEDMRQRVLNSLASASPSMLRENPEYRHTVALEATRIANKMASYMGIPK